MNFRTLLIGLLLLALCVPAAAFLGMGDIVHDPISYANALLMLAELVKNYEQLKAQFDLQLWLSQTLPFQMSLRYRAVGTSWYGLALPSNQFGNLSAWLQGVNEGGDAFTGYATASVPLRPHAMAVSRLAPREFQRVASQYASTELADGTNIHAMATIGALRANAEQTDLAIQALEDDSLSRDPSLNTEIGVLNKINAASVAALRISRDGNRALLSVMEQQVVESKQRRDALTVELNGQALMLDLGEAARAQHTKTITQSLRTFRWR